MSCEKPMTCFDTKTVMNKSNDSHTSIDFINNIYKTSPRENSTKTGLAQFISERENYMDSDSLLRGSYAKSLNSQVNKSPIKRILNKGKGSIVHNETKATPVATASPLRSRNKEHPFAHINEHRPLSYYDIENEEITWSVHLPYKIIKKIGQGKYSEVFIATHVNSNELCALKCLKPNSDFKIKREVAVLKRLFGGPNIIKLLDTVYCIENNIVILVFEYTEAAPYKTLFPKLTNLDIQFYMYQLLKTLYFSHSRGIFHRDIKPQNILIDHANKRIRLADWGLAEFYHLNRDYNTRVASRHYKAPELLLKNKYYDYSLDMWSLGCVFAALIFRKDVFFNGYNDENQLLVITKILGSEELLVYADKIGISLSSLQKKTLSGYKKQSWVSFTSKFKLTLIPGYITDTNTEERATPEALSLLNTMLVVDHRNRILPQHALLHPYFKNVRQMDSI